MTGTEIQAERTDMGTVRIEGEDFELFKDEEIFRLSHPDWALTGRGTTIEQAVQDVRYSAHNLLPVYAEHYPENVSEDGHRKVDYMLEIFEQSEDEEGNCQCFYCRCARSDS